MSGFSDLTIFLPSGHMVISRHTKQLQGSKMTTINSSSPASLWLKSQSAITSSIQTSTTEAKDLLMPTTDSVQLSAEAIAKFNAETAASKNEIDSEPLPPPSESSLPVGNDTVMPLGNGSGNDPPPPPDRT